MVAEPGHTDFGEAIDAALLGNEATGLAFTLKGVVLRRGEEVFVERVGVHAMEAWRRSKGLDGADVRLLEIIQMPRERSSLTSDRRPPSCRRMTRARSNSAAARTGHNAAMEADDVATRHTVTDFVDLVRRVAEDDPNLALFGHDDAYRQWPVPPPRTLRHLSGHAGRRHTVDAHGHVLRSRRFGLEL